MNRCEKLGDRILFASSKGGVGKTTVILNVAIAASELGEEILLLDADLPMADLSVSLGLDKKRPSIHEVLSEKKSEVELEEAIYTGPAGVKVIPAGISLQRLRRAKPQKLPEVLKKLSVRSETILVDPPSGLGDGALPCLEFCDEMVVMTDPGFMSLSDAMRTVEVAERFDTNPIGVVMSRFMGLKDDVSEKDIEEVLDFPIYGKIPEDPSVQKSASINEPVILREPYSPVSRATRELTEKIFPGEGKEVDYDDLVRSSVSEVMKSAIEMDLDFEKVLKSESEGKNRKILKRWLEARIQER